MNDQLTRVQTFQALHRRPVPFVIPNPWDPGTARILATLGFHALATTSLGVANMLGRTQVTREDVIDNVRQIVEATDLPVSADLENGFADAPRAAAETIRLAAEAGAVGGSIEDATGDPRAPLYELSLALERVQAAVETARALPVPFVLTARTETLLFEQGGLDETIRRLQAFESAGADVLYAPGLRNLEAIRAVVSAVRTPVNVVMGFADPSITLEALAEAGVRRVSVGGALSRVALAAVTDAAREMCGPGGFTFVRRMAPIAELRAAFSTGARTNAARTVLG
ncbi:MAG: isocitrate lyase/phosphoenolpyruvate mutase family protein [Myxococcales bacterium]|nr:isocitrate lyase/phosphoenolpyruvate mutase family protein [Myxococcales bacterium]